MHEQIRNIPFELKALSESGDFEGMASVYGNIDLGNDVVERGAFDKTVSKSGSKVRLMDNHRVRIGVATIQTTPDGLKAVGKINRDKQSGAEALSDLKFYRDNGLPMGMSIGYIAEDIDPAYKTRDGARHLKEVRVVEVTLTEMPMNERALVTSVKSMRDLIQSIKSRGVEHKDDFNAELDGIRLKASGLQMIQALMSSISSIEYDPEVADKVAACSESIDQFKSAFLEMLPAYMELAGKSFDFEEKAGRVLSQANQEAIEETITKLQGLLSSAKRSVEPEPAKESVSPNGETPEAERDDNPPVAEDLTPQIERIRSLIPA